MSDDSHYNGKNTSSIILLIGLVFYVVLFVFVLMQGVTLLLSLSYSGYTTQSLFYAELFQGWATVLVTATILLVGYILYHKNSDHSKFSFYRFHF